MKILLPIFLLVFASLSFGQTATPIPAFSESEDAKPKYKPAFQLPGPDKAGIFMKIQGDSTIDISNIVSGADLKKSEFESKAEYLARIIKWARNRVNPSTKRPLSETVFVFNDVASYDAEKREFTIAAPFADMEMLRLQRERQAIHVIKFVQYTDSGFWADIRRPRSLTIEAMPEVAKSIKSRIALAVYGIPVASDYDAMILSFLPLKTVAFNTQTGEIYALRDVIL